MVRRGTSRLSGRRATRAELKAAALPPLDEFLVAAPDHHKIVPTDTRAGVRYVLCDCPATSNHH
jgi:hypothetical protein